MNTVEDFNSFVENIRKGQWDLVLETLASVRIVPIKLAGLYEQIFLEMLEAGEVDAARTILRQSKPLTALRETNSEHYLRLENMLSRMALTATLANETIANKEEQRAKIAKTLIEEIVVVPKGRLLTLLGEALQWEIREGTLPSEAAFDIFHGIVPMNTAQPDACPVVCYRSVELERGSHVEAAVFSPNGQYFVVGRADGFIEVWNFVTGKLRTDLKYQQAETELMVMETSILCLAFNRDSDLLVCGTHSGEIAIWRVATGQCIKRFLHAHPQGVTSVCFSGDGLSILSSGYDQTVKLQGVRSGKTIKEFHGHTAFVNDARFAPDESHIITASSDGSIRLWDVRTVECLASFSPISKPTLATAPIRQIVPIPHANDSYVICSQSSTLALLAKATFTRYYDSGSKGHFLYCLVSSRGRFLYGLNEDGKLYCFDLESGTLEKTLPVTQNEPIGAALHPFVNALVTFDTEGVLRFWRSP